MGKWHGLMLLALALGCAPGSADRRGEAAPPPTPPTASASAPTATTSALVTSAPDTTMELPAADRARIDAAVERAIREGACAGAVVIFIRGGEVAYRRAHGARQLEPVRLPMGVDALFDVASLTKPIITATAIMQLVEQRKLTLDDPVAKHLPRFAESGKGDITVAELLAHTAGLAAANPLSDYRDGRSAALERILAAPLAHRRGERVYSDLGYIVLGALIEQLSGVKLDVFARDHIMKPLGMRATFNPDDDARAVPSERRDGIFLLGKVHDPRAAALGGVAGHAGLFASADDVARFARMLLAHGSLDDARVLTAASVARLTEARGPHTLAYSASGGGFGHTGFTGTSMWIDPTRNSALVVLTSRLHPDGKGDVTRLRQDLRSIAVDIANETPAVATGIDVLRGEAFARLAGRRVALITNHTGRASDGRRTADLLAAAEGVKLVALFSPEHGLGGDADAAVGDARDRATGLPVYSLYGEHERPSDAQLKGVDTLVFDLQDAGARFYTYTTTLGYALEAAAEHHLRMVVLDRPNPVDGAHVQGPLLDAGRESFIAYHRIVVRHGMTLGELARMFNTERKLGADLDVVAMRGWKRSMRFDDTGLDWVRPSPNLRTTAAALLYSGVALLEATNVSVGRGTDTPFELLGAPWIDGAALARDLQSFPGIIATPATFTPTASAHRGKTCQGVRLSVSDADAFDAPALGVAIALSLRRHHREAFDVAQLPLLIGHRPTHEAILRGDDLASISAAWRADLTRFEERRALHLLYR